MGSSQTLPRRGPPAHIGRHCQRPGPTEFSEVPSECRSRAPSGEPHSGTWMRRPWQMLQIFTASGYVSRMCCSISRMARVCRVNSPSFCRDTMGQQSLRPPAHQLPLLGILFPLQPHSPRPRKHKDPDALSTAGIPAPANGCPQWPLSRAPTGNLGKDLKEIEDSHPHIFLAPHLCLDRGVTSLYSSPRVRRCHGPPTMGPTRKGDNLPKG